MEDEGRAGALVARGGDVTARLFHEAEDRAEAQAGAARAALGGEGLENSRDQLRREARSAVAHGDGGVIAGRQIGVALCLAVGGGDLEPAAIAHRRGGARRQRSERGLELRRVGGDRPRLGREIEHDLDALAEAAAQRGGGRRDEFVEIDRTRIEALALREGDEIARQLGAAHRRFERVAREIQALLRRGLRVAQHLEIADDQTEQIVEIVGEAADERAERIGCRGAHRATRSRCPGRCARTIFGQRRHLKSVPIRTGLRSRRRHSFARKRLSKLTFGACPARVIFRRRRPDKGAAWCGRRGGISSLA